MPEDRLAKTASVFESDSIKDLGSGGEVSQDASGSPVRSGSGFGPLDPARVFEASVGVPFHQHSCVGIGASPDDCGLVSDFSAHDSVRLLRGVDPIGMNSKGAMRESACKHRAGQSSDATCLGKVPAGDFLVHRIVVRLFLLSGLEYGFFKSIFGLRKPSDR